MPIKSNIDSSNDLTEHVATGVITDEEMFACQNKFYETGITRLELWNMSMADVSKTTVQGMKQFIRLSAKLGQSRKYGRTAAVAGNMLQFGLARMAEGIGEFEGLPYEFRVFSSKADAIEWLYESR